MKGEMKMKRFLCVLLACLMVVPSAFAVDVSGFNDIAAVLGASELDATTAKKAGENIQFVQDGCSVGFSEENGKLSAIFIEGKGDSFIAYCCASFYLLDPDGDRTANYGQFLTAYLLAHTTTNEYTYGQTSNGKTFFIQPENGIYSFMVMN